MKMFTLNSLKILLASMAFSALSVPAFAATGEALTGDTASACAVILCLSVPSGRPDECVPPLTQYFAITARRVWQIATKRKNFLKLCPSHSGADSDTVVTRIVDGSMRPDIDVDEPDPVVPPSGPTPRAPVMER